MRYSFIEPHLEIYGGIRRIIELSNQLIKRGHDVILYHPSGKPCSWLKCHAKTRPLAYLNQDRHEVLVYNYPPQQKEFSKAKADMKVYYILHAHHLYYPKEQIIPTYQQPDVYKVACSKWVEDQARPFTGNAIPIVHGGINPHIFFPVKCRKEVDLIFYGSRRVWKGTKTIQEACKIGKFSFDSYDGKHLKQSQMARFIGKGRIFVNGSWFEGWNNCSLEAMACRLPVVTTDCGGNREFAVDGETALVVPPQNSRMMADKIAHLLKNHELYQKIASQGHERSLQFTWGRAADEWEQAMEGFRN